jgi:rhomboid protease GluP
MRIVARFLRDGFDLSMRLMGLVGLRGPRWEWKKTQWKMWLEARLAGWEMTERGIRAPVRMCRSCRALVDRSLSVCTSCGASMAGVPGGGAGRLLSAVLPQFSSLTAVLVTLNIVLLLLPLVIWGARPAGGGLFSILSPSNVALFLFGSKYTPAILEWGQVWRLVTAGFLHGGILHLAMNCYALSILGPLVEEAFGWRKMLFIYLVCDVAAFLVSTIFSPQSFSVGASGPLFGLLGFGVIYGRFRGGHSGRLVSQQLMQFLIPAIFMLFLPGIDNAAHLGGFVAGAGLGMVIDPERSMDDAARRRWALLALVSVVVLAGSFAAMIVAYGPNLQRVR